MYIRIHGPNLSGPAQRKGTFHVHERDCPDNHKYGPGRTMGGDDNGWLIEAKERLQVVHDVYSDQLAENPDATVEEWLSDFHFCPCVHDLPIIEQREHKPLHEVFECWVEHEKGSFAKLKSDDKFGVTAWLTEQLATHGVGAHFHIVIHSSSEYADGTRFIDI